jgi:hypothetical protein
VEIESFLNLHGIEDVDTRLKYLRLFRRMDLVELEIQHQKLSRSRPSK